MRVGLNAHVGRDEHPILVEQDVRTLIMAHDWSATALGPIETWPASRRSTVDLILRSNCAMVTFWGPARIIIYNEAFARIAHRPTWLGARAAHVWPDGAGCERIALDRVFSGDAFISHSRPLMVQAASAHRFDLSYSPVADNFGEIDGALVVVTETMGRLGAQQSTPRQSEALDSIGHLTAVIAHDFNNLLTGIIGNVEMASTRLAQSQSESAQGYLEGARSAARRAAGLTQRLLAFSQRQMLSPTAVSVATLLTEMAELIGNVAGPGIVVETRSEASVWVAYCDHSQLENALLSLSANAGEAMPEGGTLSIEAGNLTVEASVQGEVCRAGDYVVLTIADSGCGMEPDCLARAFEPFFTTKTTGQGAGLGLSMVYGFVKQSGGHIALQSSPGCGTVVRLYLPRDTGST